MKRFIKIVSAVFAMFSLTLFVSCSDGSSSSGSGEDPVPETVEVLDASQSTFTLEAGKSYSISLTDISLAASKTFSLTGGSWTISNPYIASVTAAGKLTPLSGGTTTIKSGTTTVTVTVEEPDREVTADPFDLATITDEIDIFCCGDSIMRDYAVSESDQYGLGQALKEYFDNTKANVVTDIANGGRSSRLFYNEDSRWPEVKRRIAANNETGKKSVVILSFGHNDQRALTDVNADYGAQFTFASKNKNNTVAGTHYDFMEKYIVEARALGAVPVCVTPFARSSFSGSEVSADGKHDWSNRIMTGDDTPRGNYPAAMKAAAAKQGAILVDMTELSAARIVEYNNAGKIKYFYVDGDNTHERTLGGLELGKIITNDLKRQGYLTSYIKETPSRVMVNKSTLAFGRLYPNASKTMEVKLSLFNINSGTVTISAPSCYQVCTTEDGTFEDSISIDCSAVAFGTSFFVKFTPAEVTNYNGDLSVTHTTLTPDFGNTPAGTIDGSTLKIAMSGAGKQKVEGGTAETVVWPMIDDNKNFLKTGTATELAPEDVKLAGLVATTARQEGVQTKDANGNKVPATLSGPYYARVMIDNTGNKWPVNDTGAKMTDVYLEYVVPASGADFVVNKISFKAASSGSGNMMWHAYYATKADFSDATPIVENANSSGTAKEVMIENSTGSEELGLAIEDGQKLYIRIYPAFKTTSESTGRSFMISNVTVEGLVQ